MATTYESVYQFIRTVLGDDDSENLMYTDSTLLGHLNFYMAMKNDPLIQPGGDDEHFAGTLTGTQMTITALRCCEQIIGPNPEYFSYKNPIITVTRKGSGRAMLNHIRRLIDRVQGGFLHMKEDNELWAWWNREARFDNDVNDDPLE